MHKTFNSMLHDMYLIENSECNFYLTPVLAFLKTIKNIL